MSEILKEILDNSMHSEYPIRFYSVHDTNLMSLLSIFSTHHQFWPPYISSLMIETWVRDSKNDESTILRMIYNGQILNLTVCFGQDQCSVSTARKALENLINF